MKFTTFYFAFATFSIAAPLADNHHGKSNSTAVTKPSNGTRNGTISKPNGAHVHTLKTNATTNGTISNASHTHPHPKIKSYKVVDLSDETLIPELEDEEDDDIDADPQLSGIQMPPATVMPDDDDESPEIPDSLVF